MNTLKDLIKDPWADVERTGNALLAEAQKEIHKKHILFGKILVPIARRIDNDDVLFFIQDTEEYAIVHLTLKGQEEQGIWPIAEIYKDIAEVENKIKRDITGFTELNL